MPRTLNANAIAEIAKTRGVEPINIVGVFWNGTQEVKYADKDLSGISGKILDISQIDEIVKIDSKGTSASLTITLDDTDNSIKTILDSTDVHKKKVIVYQYFGGLALSDAFILLAGEINTPVTWSESDRKVTFTILNKIDSREVGFAPEEGQFANVSSDLIGQTWPLVFGECVHVKATKVTEKLRGVTQSLIGIPDYTLPYKYWHLVERLTILESGYFYYQSAISYLQDIAREPQEIIDEYITTILSEDPKKQRHADLAEYIVENDKLLEKLRLLLDEVEGTSSYPLEVEQTTIGPAANNQGQQAKIDSTITAEEQILQDIADVQDRYDEINKPLTNAKNEIKALSVSLEKLKATKKLLEIETANAEYAYTHIHSIIKKVEKLLVTYTRTTHELIKIIVLMEEHSKIVQDKLTVIGGERFPQSQTVRIAVNGLTYSGSFSGKQFTVSSVEPRYSNITIATRQDTQIDAFWITDPKMNLKGHYCLTTVNIQPGDPEYILYEQGYIDSLVQNRVFKVVDQIGTKCILELIESQPSIRIKRNNQTYPLMQDLPTELWDRLELAKEHTEQERTNLLENAIEKFEKAKLDKIKSTLEKLRDIVDEATYQSEVDDINDTIYSNIHEYNRLVSKLKFTEETVKQVDAKISEQEFQTLLKLCNLNMRLVDQEFYNEQEIPNTKLYYLTGYDIANIHASSPVMLPSWFQFSPGGQEFITDKTVVALPNGTRIVTDFLPDSSLWFAEPGSDVFLVSDETEKYVANTLPSTIVSVYAYKGNSGKRQLTPVPLAYYSKSNSDSSYLPLTCATITLKKPLRDYAGEDWEDGLYVSMSSSVGSNTVDIIEWILTNYTNITPDSTSFSTVSALIDKFPSNFCLAEKKDAISLIEDLAFQSRCTVWIKNGTMYIKYLAAEPTSIETITESDVEFGSFSIEYSSTEELVTKYTVTWQADYSRQDKKNQLILRYNVPKYGELERKYDFYTYTNESLVNKSATFWLIRLANTWKRVKFRTPLTKLALETYDCVTLDLPEVATSPVKAIVEKANYDSANNTIEFECWTPVRAGEMITYDFAWPATISTEKLYPTIQEINDGYAGSVHSSVPKNINYKILPNINLVDQLELRPKDYGEAFPADDNFTTPSSPLAGLDVDDYIVTRPTTYKLPDEVRYSDEDKKPEYLVPVAEPVEEVRRTPFIGRVVSIVNKSSGKYKVKDNGNREYTVRQAGNEDPLNINQTVTVLYDDDASEYLINEAPSEKSGDIIFQLAEILFESGSGRLGSYIVKIFEDDTIESTKKDPIFTSATAFQESTSNYFFNGELVAVRKIKNKWHIQKLSETTIAKKITEGTVGIRASQFFVGNSALQFIKNNNTYTFIDVFFDFSKVFKKLVDNKVTYYTCLCQHLDTTIGVTFIKDCLFPILIDKDTFRSPVKECFSPIKTGNYFCLGSIMQDLDDYSRLIPTPTITLTITESANTMDSQTSSATIVTDVANSSNITFGTYQTDLNLSFLTNRLDFYYDGTSEVHGTLTTTFKSSSGTVNYNEYGSLTLVSSNIAIGYGNVASAFVTTVNNPNVVINGTVHYLNSFLTGSYTVLSTSNFEGLGCSTSVSSSSSTVTTNNGSNSSTKSTSQLSILNFSTPLNSDLTYNYQFDSVVNIGAKICNLNKSAGTFNATFTIPVSNRANSGTKTTNIVVT